MDALPYDRLPSATSVFADYTQGRGGIRAFYDHPPTVETVEAVAHAAAARSVPHTAVARILRAQAERWDALDSARADAIDLLGQPDAVAIVTGQQVGVLGGPLYTLYKAMTAIRLARHLRDNGLSAVAVFWLHGEDHDVDEIAQVGIGTDTGVRPMRLDVPGPTGAANGPAGLLSARSVDALIDQVADVLPHSDAHRNATLALLRRCYSSGNLTDGLARLLDALLPESGLILLDATDQAFKPHLAQLFAADVANGERVASEVAEQTERLVAVGGSAQIHVAPTNLFYLSEEGRLPIDQTGKRFVTRGGSTRWTSAATLSAEIGTHPERFSPNVALRPMAQDVLLPTAAYVAGPGEAAYYAQLRPVYRAHDLPMPVIFPRASLTLVPPAARRLMSRHGLTLPDLQGADVERALHRLAGERMTRSQQDAFDYARDQIGAAFAALEATADRLDIEPTVQATRVRIDRELDRLHLRAVRSARKQATDLEAAYLRARALVSPGGAPQERALSAVSFLSAYGADVFANLLSEVPLDPTAHHTVDLA